MFTARIRGELYARRWGDVEQAAQQCGSPIEAALFWALLTVAECIDGAGYVDWAGVAGHGVSVRFGTYDGPVDEWETFTAAVITQGRIGKYRTDFAIRVRVGAEEVRAVVECDGHDFHEKTRDQAKHDKKRDRFLQSEGWHVLRFTGSEINADPLAVAQDVWNFLDKKARAETKRAATGVSRGVSADQ